MSKTQKPPVFVDRLPGEGDLREELSQDPWNRLVEALRWEAGAHLERLDSFAAGLKLNPAHALEWAEDAFKAAGALVAGRAVADRLVKGQPPAEVVVEVRDRVLRGARWPASSTSAASNEMERRLVAGFAELLPRLERALEQAGS